MTLLLLLALLTSTLAATTALPSVTRKCGDVSIAETILPGARIDDYQVIYLDNLQIVFLLVLQENGRGRSVYRSSDEGLSWTLMSTPSIMPGISDAGVVRIFDSIAADGSVTLFFLGGDGDGNLWVSRDRGETYQHFGPPIVPKGVYTLYLHNMFPGTALARTGITDTGAGTRHAVYYVTDYGQKWEKIAEVPNMSHIEWSRISTVSPNRVYLQNYTASSSIKPWDSKIIYSDDYFKTFHAIGPDNVLTWQIIPPNRLTAITCKDTVSCSSKQLWLSEDGGKTFELATFPDRDQQIQEEKDVWLWEITDDIMWVNVQRDCDPDDQVRGICSGDLFHSYSFDKDFTLSLEDARRWDFTKYYSLNGIYIANQYFVPGESDIRSLISFNKGSTWDLIPAPIQTANHQPYNCFTKDGCGLHLHGYSDAIAYFYSVENAIGVMVASGNVGKKLENRRANVNLYYSRTGGLNWTEVRTGHYIQEIGDHGSIIIAASLDAPTNKVIYSINDGDEWRECEFSPDPVSVSNIRVDAGWDSKQFILYGTRTVGGKNEVVVVHLNFDNAYPGGKCRLVDMEEYTPQTGHGHCFMGLRTTYTRRKFGTACYYGPDWETTTKSTPCPCTAEDYDCASCFFRPSLGEACQRTCGYAEPPTDEQCPSKTEGFYEVEGGYVLIEEDKCDVSASTFKPKALVSCAYKSTSPDPSKPSNSSWKGVLIALGFAVAIWILIGCMAVYLWKNNEAFRSFVAGTFGIGTNIVQGGTLQDSDQEDVLTPGSDDELANSDEMGLSSDGADNNE